MKSQINLPNNYREIFRVDLQRDKKQALLVNGIALLITIPLFIIGLFIVPLETLFDFSEEFLIYFLKFAVMLGGIIVYMVLHELTHGITMKYFGCKKVNYGFTGIYAYAGCSEYFAKNPYIIIALAPVVFWGVVLLIINFFVPQSWFWVVYFIQITNISGAAGDFYVTYKFSKMPPDILIQDTGVAMTVYSGSENK